MGIKTMACMLAALAVTGSIIYEEPADQYNITASWFFGNLNASWIQNAPWGISSYNDTEVIVNISALQDNVTDIWANLSAGAVGYNDTIIAANVSALQANISVLVPYDGAVDDVYLGDNFLSTSTMYANVIVINNTEAGGLIYGNVTLGNGVYRMMVDNQFQQGGVTFDLIYPATANSSVSCLRIYANSSDGVMYCGNADGNGILKLNSNGSLLPYYDGVYNLGKDNAKWNNITANRFIGELEGLNSSIDARNYWVNLSNSMLYTDYPKINLSQQGNIFLRNITFYNYSSNIFATFGTLDGGEKLFSMTGTNDSATYLYIRSLMRNTTHPYNAGLVLVPGANLSRYFQFFIDYTIGPGLGMGVGNAVDYVVYPGANKVMNFGTASLSWDNCYCDDHVSTPRDTVSLEENNRGDYLSYTYMNYSDRSKNFTVSDASAKMGKEARTYASYFDVLEALPYNESTGMTDEKTIPLMLRDKDGNYDTVSTYAYLNALRGALMEKDKELADLKMRLDKAGL